MSRSPASPKSEKLLAEQIEAGREAREAEEEHKFSSSILRREINWSGFEANGFITKKELGLFLDYDKQKKEDQNDLLQEKGVEYAALFAKALDAIRTKDTVEYLIVQVDQLLERDPNRAKYFHQLTQQSTQQQQQQQQHPTDPYAPFLRVLTAIEQGYHPYTIQRTALIVAILLSTAPKSTITTQSITSFLRYVIAKIGNDKLTPRDHLAALYALKPLLQSTSTQAIFQQLDGIGALAILLTKDTLTNAQLIYTIGFNLWLLSYQLVACQQMIEKGIMKKIVSILKTQTMEKVLRIHTSVIYNVINHHDFIMNEALIGLNVYMTIETLNKRKYKDIDINPDMEFILNNLQSTIQSLSTYDMYVSEVLSGNLNWSPAHKNEVFWRENINLFEDKNYLIISKLINLLGDEEDLVREIACYDLGEFARFHPDGKRVITKLGGKAKLMVNLAHKNTKVSKAALLATQKLMVANWEFLAKSSAGGVSALVSKSAQKKE